MWPNRVPNGIEFKNFGRWNAWAAKWSSAVRVVGSKRSEWWVRWLGGWIQNGTGEPSKFRSGRCQPPMSGPRALGYYERRIAAAPPRTIAANTAARTTAAAAARLLGPWWSRRMYNTWITQSCRRATLSFSLRLLRSFTVVVKRYIYYILWLLCMTYALLLLLFRRRRRLTVVGRPCAARDFIATIVKCFVV